VQIPAFLWLAKELCSAFLRSAKGRTGKTLAPSQREALKTVLEN
jgi:hypothetical protein